MKILILSLITVFISIQPTSALSKSDLNLEDHPGSKISMSDMTLIKKVTTTETLHFKKQVRNQKRIDRFKKRVDRLYQKSMTKKSLDGLNDPVDKWLWIWTLSWGVGILISIIAGGAVVGAAISLLWLLSFVIGSFSLITWLKKKAV